MGLPPVIHFSRILHFSRTPFWETPIVQRRAQGEQHPSIEDDFFRYLWGFDGLANMRIYSDDM